MPIFKKHNTLPFGYAYKYEEDAKPGPFKADKELVEVPLELAALQRAFDYHGTGDYSLRELSDWLLEVTGRYLSHVGLHKRLKSGKVRVYS
tara:strand:- start:798 stop:1070 length:273 start_codon:yes stop_codon:yes gene_type:complete